MKPSLRISAPGVLNDPWLRKYDFNLKPQSLAILKNMRNFQFQKKFQEAAWMFMTSYLVTREEKQEIIRTYLALDLDGDGQLSREELLNGFKKIMEPSKAEEEVDIVLKNIDTNMNGTIDYTEFVMATVNKASLLSNHRLRTTFRMIDKVKETIHCVLSLFCVFKQDGSGSLELEELKVIFASGGAFIEEDVWKVLMQEVDINGDGEVF